ncbi:MAG: glycosyltransferase family 39 protein [Anaerolineae bacterium]|nr:glycosyltransferase family 39 protein [Anaerolineae bacterium]
MRSRPRTFVQRNALPIAWLVLLIIYILGGTHLVSFHGDESTQIYMSRDYGYQFILRDLERLRYSETPASATEQELRLLNGTLSKYLIGLSWHLRGFSLDDLNEQWDWGAGWDYNVQNGHRPSDDLLQTARWPSALLLAAGVVVMFLLGQAVGGRPAAYTASLYYAINPALLINGRRAMMEGSFTFFSLLTLLTACWLLLRPSWRSALALGVVSGLALASKHTAVFTVVTVFITCGVYIFARTIRTWRAIPVHIVLRLLLAAVVALLVFYALNPAWWGDPFGRAGTVLDMRQRLLAGQSAAFGAYPDFGAQVSGFLRQTLLDLPQYAEAPGWLEHIGPQITAYEASVWRGVSVGGSDFGAAILAVMIATGVWAVLRFKRIRAAVRTLIGAWALVMALTTLLLTPLEWQRYYLPVYPAVALMAGLGVSRLAAALNRANRINPTGNHARR